MDGSSGTAEGLETAVQELLRSAMEGKFDRVEDHWLKVVEEPQHAAAHIDDILKAAEAFTGDDKKRDRLGALLELLLSAVTETAAPRSVLRLYWLLVLALPEKQEHREAFCERFEQLYPLASAERAFYEACGVSTHLDPPAALRRLETLLKFHEGAHVCHSSGWGVGKVVAVDPFLKQVKVDLEGKRNHRIAIDVVDSILEPLDSEGFQALRYEGGDELRRLRDEDPARLIELVLKSAKTRSMPLKDIKSRLVPDVIAAGAWARWWTKVKAALRKSRTYRVADRAPHLVEKLDKEIHYEDELLEQYSKANWPEARQIARRSSRKGGSPLWEKIREDLCKRCRAEAPPAALEAALILQRAAEGQETQELKDVFAGLSPQGVVDAIEDLTAVDDQRKAVEALPACRPDDWAKIAEKLLVERKDAVREAALDSLERLDFDRIARIVQGWVRLPRTAPDGFCLVLGRYLKGSNSALLDPLREKDARGILVVVLDLLEHLQHLGGRQGASRLKARVGKLQEVLLAGDCQVFRQGLEGMDLQDVTEVHRRIARNDALPVPARGELLAVLTEYEPSIAASEQKAPWEEDAVYVTAEGLRRKQDEFEDLMENKLPKNFKDVGRAAAFGDLSENAEYTAALEERDKLTDRATRMKEDLDRVKMIDASMCEAGVVGLGSWVRLRQKETGKEVTYSLLGPWDADPDKGILSYTSPLGRVFFGKRKGDIARAELPGGFEEYEILDIGSHFDGRPAEA